MDYDFGLNNQNDESLRDLSEKDHEDTLKIINNKTSNNSAALIDDKKINARNELAKKKAEQIGHNNDNENNTKGNMTDGDLALSDQIKKIQEGIENEANLRRMEEQEHEATEQKKEYEAKIKEELEKSQEIEKKATSALENMNDVKAEMKKIVKIVKTLLKSNQDLDVRLFALEKDMNKEKIRRSFSSSLSPSSTVGPSNSPTITPLCSQKTICSTCIASPSCGWCRSTKKCVQGDNIGPIEGTCSFYDFGKCSESGCNGYRDCKSCLVTSNCGWCEGMKFCMEGSRDGPMQECGNGYLHKDLFNQCKANSNPLLDLEKELESQSVSRNTNK